MFQASLIHAVLLCLSVWGAYALRRDWIAILCFVVWGGWLLVLHIAINPPAVAWLYMLLLVSFLLARQVNLNSRWFAGCCSGCAVVAFSLSMWCYIPVYREHQRLLARYPAEDLQPRLDYERPLVGIVPTSAASAGTARSPAGLQAVAVAPKFDEQGLQRLEEQFIASDWHERSAQRRRRALQALSQVHEGFVADFVAQPGLGVGRIQTLRVLREHDLDPEDETPALLKAPELISQPAEPLEQSTSADEATNQDLAAKPGLQPDRPKLEQPTAGSTDRDQPEALKSLNRTSIVSFAPPLSLGGVNSQLQARGFLSHAFRQPAEQVELGDPPVPWQVNRIELVSLLQHQPAAVYVSEHLPAMDELRDAATRPVTDFESRAISQLRDGQEIVMEQRENHMRMVGAIRAIQECRRCHQVHLGGLLGAFTYELRTRPPQPVPPRKSKDLTLRKAPVEAILVSAE